MCANILTLWLSTHLKRWETDIILTSDTSKRARFRPYQCIRGLAVTFTRTGKCPLTSCNRNCRLDRGKNQKWFNALRFVRNIIFFPEGYRCWWWWKYSSVGEEGSAVIIKYYLRLWHATNVRLSAYIDECGELDQELDWRWSRWERWLYFGSWHGDHSLQQTEKKIHCLYFLFNLQLYLALDPTDGTNWSRKDHENKSHQYQSQHDKFEGEGQSLVIFILTQYVQVVKLQTFWTVDNVTHNGWQCYNESQPSSGGSIKNLEDSLAVLAAVAILIMTGGLWPPTVDT